MYDLDTRHPAEVAWIARQHRDLVNERNRSDPKIVRPDHLAGRAEPTCRIAPSFRDAVVDGQQVCRADEGRDAADIATARIQFGPNDLREHEGRGRILTEKLNGFRTLLLQVDEPASIGDYFQLSRPSGRNVESISSIVSISRSLQPTFG